MSKTKAWECEHCGAQSKDLPLECSFCKKKGKFIEIKVESASDDPVISKKYDAAMEELERYNEGCEPETLKYSTEE